MELNKPITIIIMLVVTCMLVFLFVLPQIEAAGELARQLADAQGQLQGQSMYYQSIATLQNSIASRSESLAKVDSSLPAQFELAPLVYFFQQKAAESGAAVKSIVFLDASQPAAEKKVRTISFSIDLAGNYQSLKNFLFALENSSRIFEVSTIAFASQKDQATGSVQNQAYTFKLQIKTYTY